jgi:DNA-binding NtrC family response regulator
VPRPEPRRTEPPPPLIQSKTTPGTPFKPSPAPSASQFPPAEQVTTPTKYRGEHATAPLRPITRVSVPRLVITVERENGGAVSRAITHEGELCRIGTHSSNEVTLEDPAVSRFHCRITREEGSWRIRDAGSLNGTFLSGVRIRDADLSREVVLELGSSLVRVRTGEEDGMTLVPIVPQFGALVGASPAMQRLFALLEKVSGSEINVYIEGESGTGKELVATEIVQHGSRAEKPFVVVDCGAISPNLVESELFGHVRGAFTGAERDRVGAFEAADGGTVFLDEIGELPIELQPKLLRALEQREVRRVGETRARKVNVRVICATNRDLEREVNRSRFREDLYFRLAVVTVRVPPLRERKEDLPLLVHSFLGQVGTPEAVKLFPAEVLSEMGRHDWPGNVRELRNYVERSIVLENALHGLDGAPRAAATEFDPKAPPKIDVSIPFKVAKESLVDGFERAYLRELLEQAGGNMSKAARTAGIDRMYLHRLVQKHGLRDPS